MDNKKTKLLLIISLFIIILAIIVGIIIFLKNKINDTDVVEGDGSFLEEYGKSQNNTISRNAYSDIKVCVTEYLHTLNKKRSVYYRIDEDGNEILDVDENEIKKNIYNLLSLNYINKNNITIENVYEHVAVLEEQTSFIPLEAKVIQDSEISSFVVHGLIESLDLKVIDEVFFIVNIDGANEMFSIEPLSENYNSIEEIKVGQIEEKIIDNTNNRFSRYSINGETIVKDYINLYKTISLSKPELMYELLDEEYRNNKFGSVEEFKQYVNENRKNINSIRVEKYQIIEQEDYTQYICVDQNNKYYIFNEKGALKYSVMLDTYTKDLQEFIDKYNNSDEKDKVALNIQKMQRAIKENDYKYVYNKLDNTFRTNKFGSLENFEKYIKERYSGNYTIKYGTFQKVQDVYAFDLELTDGNSVLEVQILMQLKEGTDFVMSFNEK